MSFKCTEKEIEIIKSYRQLSSFHKGLIEHGVKDYQKQKAKQSVGVLSVVNEKTKDVNNDLDNAGAVRKGQSDIETEFNEQFYIAESCSGLIFHIMCNGDLKYINESVLHSTLYSTQAAVSGMEIAFEKLLDLYSDALKATA